MLLQRGQVYFCNLGNGFDSEQGGYRPVVILQNNIGNNNAPTTIVAPLTTANKKNNLPTHIRLSNDSLQQSIVLLEQVKTISKKRLSRLVSQLTDAEMEKIDKALKISLGLV